MSHHCFICAKRSHRAVVAEDSDAAVGAKEFVAEDNDAAVGAKAVVAEDNDKAVVVARTKLTSLSAKYT